MAADETILIDVKGNADKYARSISDAANGTLKLARAQAVLDAGVAAVQATFEKVIRVQIEARREIDRLAASSQLTTRTIAGLRLAAQRTGQSVEDIVPIDLADRLRDLQDGTQSIVDDFKLLELTAADLVGLNLDQSFALISDRLATVASDTDRAAAATRLFGGNGERLISVITGGADELERFSKAAENTGVGTKEAADAARNFGAALADLDLAAEDAGATLLSALSDAGGGSAVRDFALGLSAAMGSAGQAIREFGDSLRLVAALDVSVLDPRRLIGIYDRIFGAGIDNARDFYGAITAGAANANDVLVPTRREVSATATALKSASREATDAAAPVYDLGAALRELTAISRDAQADQLTAEQRIGEIYDARIEAIDAVIAAARLQGATAEEIADLEIRAAAATTAAEEEKARALRQIALDAWNERKRLRALEDAQNEAAIAKRKADTERAATDITALTAQAGYSLAELLEDSGKRTRGAALAAFRIAQVSAIAQATINAALAASQGLAAAPPPFSFALAAANAAAGAVQVATIAAQQPPSFHVGSRAGDLAPDEMSATLTRREVVLTPQGQQMMAADANAGVRRNDGGSIVVVQIGHQVVGRAAAESIARPDSLLKRAVKRDLPGHSRRRTS